MENVYKKKSRQSIIFCLIFFSVFLSSKMVTSKMIKLEKEEAYIEKENSNPAGNGIEDKEEKLPTIEVSTVNNETTINNDTNIINNSSFTNESFPMLINNQGMYYTVKKDDGMSLYFTDNSTKDSESILIKSSNSFKNFNRYGPWLIFVENNDDKVDVITAYNHISGESIYFDRELDKHLMSSINSMLVKENKIYYTNDTDQYIFQIDISTGYQSKVQTGLSDFSDLWILSVQDNKVQTYSSYGVLETNTESEETNKITETDSMLYGIMYKDSSKDNTYYLLNGTLKGIIIEKIDGKNKENIFKDLKVNDFLLLGDYTVVRVGDMDEVYKDDVLLATSDSSTGSLKYIYKNEIYKSNGLGKPQKLSLKVN